MMVVSQAFQNRECAIASLWYYTAGGNLSHYLQNFTKFFTSQPVKDVFNSLLLMESKRRLLPHKTHIGKQWYTSSFIKQGLGALYIYIYVMVSFSVEASCGPKFV